MSELEQAKHHLKEVIDQVSSVEVLREVTSQLEAQNHTEVIEIGPETREGLRQSEEEYKAGRYYTLDEARTIMETRFPYLKKG